MVEYEHLTPDTVRIAMTGAVPEDDLVGLAEALADSLGPDPGSTLNLLIEMDNLDDLESGSDPEADRIETGLAPLLPRIRRVAAVSGRGWVAMGLRAASGAWPGLEPRVFGPDEREAARDFALGQLAEAGDGPALRLLDSGHPDLIAYEIDGVLNQEDADRVMGLLERALDRDRLVSLLVKIRHYGGFDPTMLLSGPLWTMKLSGIRNLHRYAVVGAEPWMQSVAKFANPMTLLNMRLFSNDAEAEAWDWVREGLGGRG